MKFKIIDDNYLLLIELKSANPFIERDSQLLLVTYKNQRYAFDRVKLELKY